MNETADPAIAATIDSAALYKEETYTDRKVGTITKLIPVNAEGEVDGSRSDVYLGATQIMTPAGALPINFEIEADSLADAAEQFGVLAKQSMDETIKELQELQRKQASSIVVPGEGSGIQIP